MWARTIEFTLAIWLGISWMIFKYNVDTIFLLWNDIACFVLISCFSLLSYSQRLRHIHLLNFALAVWLIFLAYYLRNIGIGMNANNYMTVALLLLMLTIVPSDCNRPPYQWFKYMTNKK